MFHGTISLNSVLLLLLMKFVSGFRLEMMYLSLIKSIRSSLTQKFTAICADDTTLYFKFDKASDMWQQPELASELESEPQDTVNWGYEVVC